MLREVDWSKVCTSQHVWAVVMFWCSSVAFINVQIQHQDHKAIKVIVFNSISLMTAYCILKTIRTHPGRVPIIWMFQKCRVKKYCLLCHNFKPDRTHHCSTCGICVLNMDHHCPWLSNCIGFYNRKSFFLAVLYGWLSLVVGIMLCVSKAMDYKKLQTLDIVVFLLPVVILGGMLVLLTIFLKFHITLVLDNMTTIEHLEKKRALFPDDSPNKYDVGWYKNFQQVFGTNMISWFIPTAQTVEIDLQGESSQVTKISSFIEKNNNSQPLDSVQDLQLGRLNIQKGDTSFNQSRVSQSSRQKPINSMLLGSTKRLR